jgi:hypothetical protein
MVVLLMGSGLLLLSIALVVLAKKHNQPRGLGFAGIALGGMMVIYSLLSFK